MTLKTFKGYALCIRVIFLFLPAAIFLSACSSDVVTEETDNLSDINQGFQISFDTKDELDFQYHAKPAFGYAQVYRDSIDLLVCPNRQQNSIDFYRMDSGEKIDSVLLPLEGPNALPRLSNFLFHSDTIYTVNAISYELVVFNTSGIVLKRIKIRPQTQSESLMPNAFIPLKIVKIRDLIYVSGDPDLNIRDQKSYKKGKYAYEINIRTGQFRSVFEVPPIFHNDQWMVNQYFYSNLYDRENDRWLFSFQVDDSIRVYNIDGKKEAFFAGSQFSGKIKRWNKDDLNSEKAYSYYLKNKVYGKIIYDKKNKLYYRFVFHPNQDAIANRDINRMWARRYSIVILNENLTVVGETEVKQKHFGQDHISTDDGVYLSYYKEEEAVEGVKRYVKMNPINIEY